MSQSAIYSALAALLAVLLLTPDALAQRGVPSNTWSLFGNRDAGADAYLGTTDATPLKIGANRTVGLVVGTDGAVSVGTAGAPFRLDVTGALGVAGTTTLGGTLGVTGASRFGGAARFGDILDVAGATTLGDDLTVAGATTLGGTLGVTGASRFGGAATFDGDLTVAGLATLAKTQFTDDASFGANVSVSGGLTVDGNTLVSGTLSVGGTDATGAGHALFVNGRLRTNGINELSDARFKRGITRYTGGLDAVLRLRGVRYEWRREEHPALALAAGPQVGLIAQEVEAVVPEVVHTDADGVKTVEYAHLVPVLIEALREQQALIQQQAEALARLQGEIGGLRTALASAVGGSAGLGVVAQAPSDTE